MPLKRRCPRGLWTQLPDTARAQIPADMPQPAGPAFRRLGGGAGSACRQRPASALVSRMLGGGLVRKRIRGGDRFAQLPLRFFRLIGRRRRLQAVRGLRIRRRPRIYGKPFFLGCLGLASPLCRNSLCFLRLRHQGFHHFPAAFNGGLVAFPVARLGLDNLVLPLDEHLGRNGRRLHRSGYRAFGLGRRIGGSRLKELFSMLPGLGSRTGRLRRILPGRRRSRGWRGLGLGRNRSRTPDLDEERLGRGLHSGMYVVCESWNSGSITPSIALGKPPDQVKCEIPLLLPTKKWSFCASRRIMAPSVVRSGIAHRAGLLDVCASLAGARGRPRSAGSSVSMILRGKTGKAPRSAEREQYSG